MFYDDYGCDNVFDVPHTERSMLLASISVYLTPIPHYILV